MMLLPYPEPQIKTVRISQNIAPLTSTWLQGAGTERVIPFIFVVLQHVYISLNQRSRHEDRKQKLILIQQNKEKNERGCKKCRI